MALKKTKYRPLSRTQKIGTTFEIINETLDSAVTELEGLRYAKTPVRLVTTSPLPAFTDLGNELEANSNGLLVIDGVEVEIDDRVLIASEYRESTAPFNGIYNVVQSGSSVSKWKLERAADSRLEEDFINGVMVLAVDGQKNKDIFFSLSSESLENLSVWKESNPSLSPIGNVPLLFTEVTFGGGGIMGTPVVLEEVEVIDELGVVRKRYVLPYSGLHEMVWIDGILQIRGVHYDVEDGYLQFKPTLGAVPRKGFNVVTASAALFIASSLKNAGGSFTSPMVVNVQLDAETGKLFAEVPGAGDDEIVWIDGLLLTRGKGYTRLGNRIILSNALIEALKSLYDGETVFSETGESDSLLFEEEDPFGFELAISGEKLPLLDTNAFKLNGVPGTEYVRKFQQGSISYFDSIENLKKYLPVDAVKPTAYSNGMLAAIKEKGLYRFNATSTAPEQIEESTGIEKVVIPYQSPDSTSNIAMGRWELIVSYKPVGTSNADNLGGYPAANYVRKLASGSITFHDEDDVSTRPIGLEDGAILASRTPRSSGSTLKKSELLVWKTGTGWVKIDDIEVHAAEGLTVGNTVRLPNVDAVGNTVAVRDSAGTLKSVFPAIPGEHTVVSLDAASRIPSTLLDIAGTEETKKGIVWVDPNNSASGGSKNILTVGSTGKLSANLTAGDIKTIVDAKTSAADKPLAALLFNGNAFTSISQGSNISLDRSGDNIQISGPAPYTLTAANVKTVVNAVTTAAEKPQAALLFGSTPFTSVSEGSNITLTISSSGNLKISSNDFLNTVETFLLSGIKSSRLETHLGPMATDISGTSIRSLNKNIISTTSYYYPSDPHPLGYWMYISRSLVEATNGYLKITKTSGSNRLLYVNFSAANFFLTRVAPFAAGTNPGFITYSFVVYARVRNVTNLNRYIAMIGRADKDSNNITQNTGTPLNCVGVFRLPPGDYEIDIVAGLFWDSSRINTSEVSLWTSSTTYAVNSIVLYNNRWYVCSERHSGITPQTESRYWYELGFQAILQFYPVYPATVTSSDFNESCGFNFSVSGVGITSRG